MTSDAETLEARERAPLFFLVSSLRGRGTVRIAIPEDADVVFGRASAVDVDVVVDDPGVSRRHALVRRSGGAAYVQDLGSRNGTVVCGETLRGAQRRVGAGDRFEVGPLHVIVAASSAGLVVADPAMRKIHAAIQRVARRGGPVLLLGEPGVGKATLAERIHDLSARAEKPYVVFPCGSVPERSAHAELFGGNEEGGRSLLESAQHGTLFLADVDLLSPLLQEELFLLLHTRTTRRGKQKGAAADVRILCSSCTDLGAAVRAGHFHEKLHALVATLAITIPPLRDRRIEIPVLSDHLLRQIAESLGMEAKGLTPEAEELLCAFPWSRNVSDLRDVLEYATALSEGARITSADLPVSFTGTSGPSPLVAAAQAGAQKTRLRMTRASRSLGVAAKPVISLARKGSLWRILVRLAEEHDRSGGGAAVGTDALFGAGWPGEKAVGQSAEGRLRTAIWMLRKLGLHEVLVTREDGYLLDPSVVVAWE